TCARLAHVLLGALALSAAVPLHAQQFPARPVRLVVPYPAGGANDIVARLIAPKMGEQLGQNVVVDNRGGGNTLIGSELVAKAVPNGYTILIVAAGHAINPSLYPRLPYDTARDFAPISLIGDGAYVLVTHPSTGISSVTDLIAAAKSKPGQITYASSSIGNLTHLAAELFNSLAGVKMLHVPYKGGNPAMADILGGRVAVFFSTVAVARPHLQSGKIRGLGVTTARRTMALPNLPTIAEAGLPGYEVSGWYGLVAPAATPKAVIARLHSVAQMALRQPDIREKLLGVGVEATESTTAQFGEKIKVELAKWEKIVKPLGIKPE
ncbi:MAG TPA: tripartite tricarboxylate transporter substrate binding protein, partial [Burkholderiales bacterium]|nr:tripartite tricarboxylate transporter substrate binding protein [Burkholderiales bacterium]